MGEQKDLGENLEGSVNGEASLEEDPEAIRKRLAQLKETRNNIAKKVEGDIQASGRTVIDEENLKDVDLNDPEAVNAILQSSTDVKRDVSAASIGRMLGLVTLTEFKLVEGKIDLLSTRVNNLTIKLDKILAALAQAPTGADLDRIDVQIGALRTLLKDRVMESAAPDSKTASAKIISNQSEE